MKREPCPAGIDPKEWRLFLARIEFAKQRAEDPSRRLAAERLAAAKRRSAR